MELEQLIQMWKAAGSNFSQEAFNKTLIQEMIRSKSNSAIRKLYRIDLIGLIAVIIIMPLVPWIHYQMENSLPFIFGSQILVPGRIFYVSLYILIPAIIIWYILKLRHLKTLDITRSLTENQLHIEKYCLMEKYEMIGGIIIGVVLFSLGIILYALMNVSIYLWMFMGCVIILICLICIYLYKTVYIKQITVIRQNIKELKELEDKE